MKTISILLILIITSFAGRGNEKDTKKYVGTYKTTDEQSCSMELIITSQADGYHYKLKTKSKVKEGHVEIIKMNDEVYLKFIGLRGAKPKDEVEGQYIDETIVIQNDGNAMNRYTNFKECDMKYIEFLKTEIKSIQ